MLPTDSMDNNNSNNDMLDDMYSSFCRSPTCAEDLSASCGTLRASSMIDEPEDQEEDISTTTTATTTDLEEEEDEFTRLRRSMLPPINRETLKELDLLEMHKNIQLRHDLVFDAKLMFRPNLAGRHGAAKQKRREKYWEALREELEGPSAVEADESATAAARVRREKFEPNLIRIPLLIAEAKEAVAMLLPLDDELSEEINGRMDVPLITQEVIHGVFDVENFVRWISGTLREYCNEERYEVIEEMVSTAKEGRIAEAFKMLFEIFELLKLDVANYQLHNIFRPHVLEYAVDFEWRHFQIHLDADLTSLDGALEWLSDGAKRNHHGGFEEVFYESVVHLVTESAEEEDPPIPETFHLDGIRLHNLHNDFQDLVIMATVLLLFRQAAGPKCTSPDIGKVGSELWILLVKNGTTISHIATHIAHAAGKIRGKPFTGAERGSLESMMEKTLNPESPIINLLQKRLKEVVVEYLTRASKSNLASVDRDAVSDESELESESESDSSDSSEDESETKKVPGFTKSSRRQRARAPAATTKASAPEAKLSSQLLTKFGLKELEKNIMSMTSRILALANHNRAVYRLAYQSIWEFRHEAALSGPTLEKLCVER